MSLIGIQPNKTLEEMGLDQFGQSPLVFLGQEKNRKTQTMYEAGVPSNFIQTGDIIQRLNLIDGYLQSSNFVTGSTGWRIDSDGDVEFSSGTFRGALAAASGTFVGDITAATGLFAGTMNWSGINAGTNSNALNVGHGNVKIDGANKRVIINDGTNDRCLMGYLSGKF